MCVSMCTHTFLLHWCQSPPPPSAPRACCIMPFKEGEVMETWVSKVWACREWSGDAEVGTALLRFNQGQRVKI